MPAEIEKAHRDEVLNRKEEYLRDKSVVKPMDAAYFAKVRDSLHHNVFLAIRPTPEAGSRIEMLLQQSRAAHGLHGTRVLLEHLHVTLHHIGHYLEIVPPAVLDGVRAICAEVASSLPSFEVTLDRTMSFRNNASKLPFVLQGGKDANAALKNFQRHLGALLKDHGFNCDKSFTPHLTLLRDRQCIDEARVEPVSWTVQELFLIDSHVGKTHHELVGQWPLLG